jgi:hypothetical protein
MGFEVLLSFDVPFLHFAPFYTGQTAIRERHEAAYRTWIDFARWLRTGHHHRPMRL